MTPVQIDLTPIEVLQRINQSAARRPLQDALRWACAPLLARLAVAVDAGRPARMTAAEVRLLAIGDDGSHPDVVTGTVFGVEIELVEQP